MTVAYSGMDISFIAAEDISAHQYNFVHQASDTTCDLLDGTTEYPVGILQNAPESGGVAVVRITGTSKLVMNAVVAVGAKVKAEYVGAADNGKGDAADTDYDLVRGICIKASGAEDDVGAVLLCSDTLMVN
jgi:hypothetical protein